ncbi:MAG: hypothetical protein Ct9H90mP8_1460 [Pseudomonadota bacterium]|nr:MAG: hypothetical protein Ct9H90mP8_1460 [Pseudomonadota bacterium]
MLDSKFQNLFFLPRKASSLTEWKPLSYSEKKPALLKQRRHKRRPKRESISFPNPNLAVPLRKKASTDTIKYYRPAFLSILVFGITYWISSKLLPNYPRFSPSAPNLIIEDPWLFQIPHIALSLGTALLTVAVLIYLRTRLINHQVDILCRQFLSYRREHEEGELEISTSDRIRSGLIFGL